MTLEVIRSSFTFFILIQLMLRIDFSILSAYGILFLFEHLKFTIFFNAQMFVFYTVNKRDIHPL